MREDLPDRRRVLDAAGVPKLIESARYLQFRLRADIAVIDLAIIADTANDANGPVSGQSELFTVIPLGSDQSHHVWLFGFQRLIDVLGGDAEFFGIDHRI